MKGFKILLAVITLTGLVLIPARCIFAQNETVSSHPGQSTQISLYSQTGTQINTQLKQIPSTTPNTSETTINATPAPATRVFFPFVIAPQLAYFVSPSGNDSNPGTFHKPWRTIQKAADTLVAGDTVKILPGTYNEKFTPKNSGNPEAYITYTADPGTVVLDGSGVTLSTDPKGDGLVQIQGKSYIKVQNLTIRNASVNCVNISENSSGTGSTYIEIIALTIQNCNIVGIRARITEHLLLKDNQINHTNF